MMPDGRARLQEVACGVEVSVADRALPAHVRLVLPRIRAPRLPP